jgi:hypothetical protein
VRRGLVERKRMRQDRRTYRLNVTAAGKQTLTMLTRCARRHERVLDGIIGRRDRKRFLQILKKIAVEVEWLSDVVPAFAGTTSARRETSPAPRPELDAI